MGPQPNPRSIGNRDLVGLPSRPQELTARLLPLAAIVTPGTLNVIAVNATTIFQYPVAQYNFNNSTGFGNRGNNGGAMLGASPALQRLSFATASSSEISQIHAPFANSSYKLEFFAPAVSCTPANASLVTRVTGWLESLEGANSPWLCFVPTALELVGSDFNPFNTSDEVQKTFFGTGSNYDFGGKQTVDLFATMYTGGTFAEQPMVNCTLYNASYETSFDFTHPQQNISVIQRTLHEPILTPNDPNASFGTPEWAYMNMMDAFATILVGFTEGSSGGSSSYKTMFQVTALQSLKDAPYIQPLISADQLGSMLETIFQNITLSLLSDSAFQ
jgi:hypothetical protein